MSRPGPGGTPGAFAADPPGAATPRPRRKVTFRLPVWALLLPVIALLCCLPLATAGGGFTWLAYGVPVLVLAATVLTRTSADARRLVVSGPWRRHTIAWADLDRLEFTGTRWAVAVTGTGRRVRLVMVRPRDLPALTAVAGGELLLAENQQSAPDVAGSGDGSPSTGTSESAEAAEATKSVEVTNLETAETTAQSEAADTSEPAGTLRRTATRDGDADGASSIVRADPADQPVDERPPAPPHPAGERTGQP